MSKVKIETLQGSTRVWIDDKEIENVKECNIDMNASRLPITTLKIETENVDISTLIDETAINLDRYEVRRIGKSLNTAFDKAYDKKNS